MQLGQNHLTGPYQVPFGCDAKASFVMAGIAQVADPHLPMLLCVSIPPVPCPQFDDSAYIRVPRSGVLYSSSSALSSVALASCSASDC